MSLEYLWTSAPASVTGAQVSSTQMPAWYQEYLRGIAGKATEIAGQDYQPYEGTRIADFNADQQNAFNQTRQNQGSWQTPYSGALSAAQGIQPGVNGYLGTAAGYGQAGVNSAQQFGQQGVNAATQYGTQAVNAVGGPAQAWPDQMARYMNPYTAGVVDEIGRLGNRNLTENILPGINGTFTGSGQFGSTRNAEILGRGIRDAQRDISGQQAMALERGYGTSADIFGADANRAQQQGSLQANTALGAGQMVSGALDRFGGALSNANFNAAQLAGTSANTALSAGQAQAGALSDLAQQRQQLGLNDAAALGTIGGQQQQLQQGAYDTAYQEFLRQQGWDQGQLGFLSNAVRGLQLPTTASSSNTTSTQAAGTSPLSWINALYGITQS